MCNLLLVQENQPLDYIQCNLASAAQSPQKGQRTERHVQHQQALRLTQQQGIYCVQSSQDTMVFMYTPAGWQVCSAALVLLYSACIPVVPAQRASVVTCKPVIQVATSHVLHHLSISQHISAPQERPASSCTVHTLPNLLCCLKRASTVLAVHTMRIW